LSAGNFHRAELLKAGQALCVATIDDFGSRAADLMNRTLRSPLASR
jgi:hypothetical protein